MPPVTKPILVAARTGDDEAPQDEQLGVGGSVSGTFNESHGLSKSSHSVLHRRTMALVPNHGPVRGITSRNLLQLGPSLHKRDKQATMDDLIKLYARSREMQLEEEQMDLFVSHTWSSNAFLKYLALLYTINGKAALLAAHAAALTAFVIMLGVRFGAGLMPPTVQVPRYLLSEDTFLSFICVAVGGVTQLLVLLFGHIFPKRAQEMVFFDKCCICQHDEELKRAGILTIGHVLENTKRMVLLWDTQYFERLWCTYEVAAFSSRSPFEKIRLMPLMLAVWVCSMFFIVFFGTGSLLATVSGLGGTEDASSMATYLVVWLLLGPALFWFPKILVAHQLTIGRVELFKQLQSFSVRDANVFDEKDRVFVEAQIEDWFGTLEAFDQKVRVELGDYVKKELAYFLHLRL